MHFQSDTFYSLTATFIIPFFPISQTHSQNFPFSNSHLHNNHSFSLFDFFFKFKFLWFYFILFLLFFVFGDKSLGFLKLVSSDVSIGFRIFLCFPLRLSLCFGFLRFFQVRGSSRLNLVGFFNLGLGFCAF